LSPPRAGPGGSRFPRSSRCLLHRLRGFHIVPLCSSIRTVTKISPVVNGGAESHAADARPPSPEPRVLRPHHDPRHPRRGARLPPRLVPRRPPFLLPTPYARVDAAPYLHGAAASRVLRGLRDGIP